MALPSSLTSPRSIALFRALQLGDLLCAVPAWRALRAAYPDARILLIGLPWAKALVSRYSCYLDEFIEFPGYPGLPEQEPDFRRLEAFLKEMRTRAFDCVIQMQGDGTFANDVVGLCGAGTVTGFCPPSGPRPDGERFLPYPSDCSEVHRHLRLMEFLGVPSCGDHLEFPLTDEDRAAFFACPEVATLSPGSFVCVHPGGRGSNRRWAAHRFAEVAAALTARGLRVVLTGTEAERELADAVSETMPTAPINMVGRTTLGTLGVLLSRAKLLIANDTGVSHLAAALGTPSVIVSVGSDPVRWNPLDHTRHSVLEGSDTTAEAVLAEAESLMGSEPAARPSRVTVEPRPLRILTWHVHGNYLYYLTHTPHRWWLPVGLDRPGYSGAAPGFPWSDRVQDVPVEQLRRTAFDCILFQSQSAYLTDQYELLSAEQRRLPRIYLEHDPPDDPTDSRHLVRDQFVQLVHVTHFNRLAWDNGGAPVSVIEHGVPPTDVSYNGELTRGLVVINDLPRRGRRVGADLVRLIGQTIPLDIVGMNSEQLGGLGEISHAELPAFMARYRFFFHPVRYTSFGLAVCEAMQLGVPIVALPVTDMPSVLQDGWSGCLASDTVRLMERMARLLADRDEARRIGERGRAVAETRFSLVRFTADWDRLLRKWVHSSGHQGRTAPEVVGSPTGMACAAGSH